MAVVQFVSVVKSACLLTAFGDVGLKENTHVCLSVGAQAEVEQVGASNLLEFSFGFFC